MRVPIEMVLPSESDLKVLYKCPFCCSGDKMIGMTFPNGEARDWFVNNVLSDQAMQMACKECANSIILEADPSLKLMFEMAKCNDSLHDPKQSKFAANQMIIDREIAKVKSVAFCFDTHAKTLAEKIQLHQLSIGRSFDEPDFIQFLRGEFFFELPSWKSRFEEARRTLQNLLDPADNLFLELAEKERFNRYLMDVCLRLLKGKPINSCWEDDYRNFIQSEARPPKAKRWWHFWRIG